MIFLPLATETLAELAAIEAELDHLKLGNISRRNELERERDAIYQADYDLSKQHRGAQ